MKQIIILSLLFIYSCSSKIKVESVTVQKGYVENTVSTINSGTVEAKKQAELSFGTIGRISKVHTHVGEIVSEGTLIAELENSDLKAIYDEASKEFNRSTELFKSGLVSTANLDSARRAKEVAKINFEKTIIKAPFRGMITALDLKIGEFYQTQVTATNKPKAQIIDLDKRIVKGEIDEIDLSKVSNNQVARIKIPALKNLVFEGIVKKVVPFVSTAKDQDRTSEIEIELKINSEKEMLTIPVGASADVEIISSKKENVTIIPTSFIHGVGQNRFVYLLMENKIKKQNIKMGSGNYDRTEILEGLNIGDKISSIPDSVEDVEKIKVESVDKKWP